MEQSAAAGPTGHMLGNHVVTRNPAFQVSHSHFSPHIEPLYADCRQWVSDRGRANILPKIREDSVAFWIRKSQL